MSLNKAITDYLERTYGINAEVIGHNRVDKVLAQRQQVTAAGNPAQYLAFLKNSQGEQQMLIAELTVPETWFFRDRGPFELLKTFVLEQWLPSHKNQVLNILCLPCATGEEAYSVSMTLILATLPTSKFRIDAVDLNQTALKVAVTGDYSEYSFRGVDPVIRDRFFTRNGDNYRLEPEVKEHVSFVQGNVLSPDSQLLKRTYSVIFCRNLLIYFTPEQKRLVVKRLIDILEPDGLLFTGHAEMQIFKDSRLTAMKHPKSFAYQKRSRQTEPRQFSQQVRPDASSSRPTSPRQLESSPHKVVRPAAKPRRYPDSAQPMESQPDTLLSQARTEADRGNLETANSLCLKYLNVNKTDANAYVLLGSLQTAMNQVTDAETSFNKALYLNPDDYQALLNLALLRENQGRTTDAQLLKKRAKRVSENTSGTTNRP